MATITTVKGIPQGRAQITPLQREVLGAMIDAGLYSYEDLAKHLRVTPWTLSKTLRGRRGNPHTLKKIEAFIQRQQEVSLRRIDRRNRAGAGDGRSAA